MMNRGRGLLLLFVAALASAAAMPVAAAPPTWTLTEVKTERRRVELQWRLSTPWTGSARVERSRGVAGAWSYFADQPFAPDNTITIVDTTVAWGGEYGYQVGVQTDEGWVWSYLVVMNIIPAWNAGEATVEGYSTRVKWWLAASNTGTARIERQLYGEEWTLLSEVPIDSYGRVSYVDYDNLAPGHYGYRAAWNNAGEWVYSEVLWTDRLLPQLAFSAKPAVASSTAPTVSFIVPRVGVVRIDCFDAAGRRVGGRELGADTPGSYTVSLEGRFAPGVYYVRLAQAGESIRTRALVLGGNR